ncbi:hypothetical protein Nepgr_017010 [Nepenthes gracilis]|uniref:Anaphase-promoting complex subunit 4-like WD40 domain-containing protein n=1 Tax=Nepenthes gracilis TaxID=150966 RepID=A0AAD3SQS3_NEPGR|nr:hypothetical protein Nepgr_017010 [Nepenthes gracilis]
MGKSTIMENLNCQKYGVPLYGASWVPQKVIRSNLQTNDDDEVAGDGSLTSDASITTDASTQNYLVLAGGGGEGRSGIPNALLLAQFDFASNSLSDSPVDKLGTGADLPYRMAVHPDGEGLICSLPKSCRWFKWNTTKSHEKHKLGLTISEEVLTELEDVGQQLAVTFSDNGSLFAAGGEDGKLRVFKWPTMEIILNEGQSYSAVKNLDFSVDGKFLVSVGSGGPCRVWDVTSSKAVALLQKENDEVIGFCRFSRGSDGNQVLYTTSMQGERGSIVTWNTSSWNRMASKQIIRDPISAFNVSDDGKLLAIGTIQGDILVINSTNMHVQMTVKKAHLGLVTALMFSSNSRALVSASLDSSARVTIIQAKNKSGFNYWIIVIIGLLAILVYLVKTKGLIP